MADSKQTVVAFLTSSSDSSVVDFVHGIGKELPEHICKYVRLSNNVLESFHMRGSERYDAVVLLHSVQEGRNSITDVPDAKYQEFLPELKNKYGAGRVAVVVFSMPSLQHSYNKDTMMLTFVRAQPTTFDCSQCVIQCHNLHSMFPDYRHKLIKFLIEAPDSPLPVLDTNREGDDEKNQSAETTGEGLPSENENPNSLQFFEDAVALLNHSGSEIDGTPELLKILNNKFNGITFKPLDEQSVENINCFKAVLVLVGKKDCETKGLFAASTSDYRDKIAPNGHLGWLIMEEMDGSAVIPAPTTMSRPRVQTASTLPQKKAKIDILIESKGVSVNVKCLYEKDKNTIGTALAASPETPSKEDASSRQAAHAAPSGVSSAKDWTDDVTTPAEIAEYCEATTKRVIERAIEPLVDNLKRVEAQLGQAIEIESRIATELKELTSLKTDVAKHNEELHKAERFSRRNKIRQVGFRRWSSVYF